MKKYLTYFRLQLKMVIKSVPAILFGTLVLTTLLVLGVLAANGMMEKEDNEVSGIDIALVINDDNKYTDMAISLLMGEENIKKMCNFIEMSEEKAFDALEKGEVTATVIVPENFLTAILNGTNIPARIIMADDDGFSQSAIFRELVNAGATDLATAQAAVYAVDDLCMAAGIDAIEESENYLNKNLFLYALGRNTYYDEQEISKTGDLTLVEFYIASGIVMFLLFGGVICSDLLCKDNSAFGICVGRAGIKKWMIVASKLLSVSVVYFVMLAVVCVVAGVMGLIKITGMTFFAIAVGVIAIFAINLFVFQLADNRITGSLVLFITTILMMFVGGNIVPEVFLPEIVNSMGRFMPTRWLVQLVGQVVTGEVLWMNILICALVAVAFTGLTIGFKSIEER